MKIPKARKLPSGSWFIQLRLGGKSVPVTASSERACIRDAQAIKAAWIADKALPAQDDTDTILPGKAPEGATLTLTAAIDSYIAARDAILSPATVRGYRTIQRNRWPEVMSRRICDIADDEWQTILNAEAKQVGPATVEKGFDLCRTVIKAVGRHEIPLEGLTMPEPVPHVTPFLTVQEIPTFVAAVKDLDIAVPCLLALSSLRISEICALRWESIPPNPEIIHVAGAVVPGPDHKFRRKDANKNYSSARNVPVLIPELVTALERDRQPRGPVMRYSQSYLRDHLHDLCQRIGVTDVPPHGLRHSFASLAYSQGLPEQMTMEIGGWADTATMHKIYTHIAQCDVERYKKALGDFYNPQDKNANKNANEK